MKPTLQLTRNLTTAVCQYAGQSAKNCVKRLLGRKPYYDPRFQYLRQYILHLLGLRRIRAITCIVTRDCEGAGSQAFHFMKTINCARSLGLQYLHSPFREIAHADRPMDDLVAAWEAVFNFGAGEALYQAGKREAINFYGLEDLDLYFGRRGPDELLKNHFKSMIPEFRRKYYLNKSPRTNRVVTVAVHIRRGDVSPHAYSYMYTSTEKILAIAGAVQSLLESRGIAFELSVYGETANSDFDALSARGARLHLDADPIWTLQELVEADILIVARSHFSYCAGLLSDGIKIFEPHGRPGAFETFSMAWQWTLFSELEDWIPCQEDGAIDRAAFERRLALLLDEKQKV